MTSFTPPPPPAELPDLWAQMHELKAERMTATPERYAQIQATLAAWSQHARTSGMWAAITAHRAAQAEGNR